MPTLSNPKHELFAHYRALGESQGNSYRKAWQSKANDATCGQEGHYIDADPIVSQRIRELKDVQAAKLRTTRDEVASLWMDLAKNANTDSGRAAGLNGISKMLGFNEPEKIEHSFDASITGKTFASLFEDEEEENDE